MTVLDGELNSNTETLPCGGSLGDIFSDLLGRLFHRNGIHSALRIGHHHRGRTHQTKGTDFRCQSRGGTDLTTGRPEVDDFNFVGVLNSTNSHIDEYGQDDDIARAILTSLGAMVVGGFGGGA